MEWVAIGLVVGREGARWLGLCHICIALAPITNPSHKTQLLSNEDHSFFWVSVALNFLAFSGNQNTNSRRRYRARPLFIRDAATLICTTCTWLSLPHDLRLLTGPLCWYVFPFALLGCLGATVYIPLKRVSTTRCALCTPTSLTWENVLNELFSVYMEFSCARHMLPGLSR